MPLTEESAWNAQAKDNPKRFVATAIIHRGFPNLAEKSGDSAIYENKLSIACYPELNVWYVREPNDEAYAKGVPGGDPGMKAQAEDSCQVALSADVRGSGA